MLTQKKDDHSYERQDFRTSTKNKQLNFLQHVKTLLAINRLRETLTAEVRVAVRLFGGKPIANSLLRE